MPNGKNAVPSLFLLDAEHKQLTLSERDTNGVWQVVKNIDLPVTGFADVQTVQARRRGVAFTGQNSVAWLPLAGEVWELTKLDDYDTPIKDGYLNDLIAGDLTGGGRKQLIFMETAKNYIDLVFFDKQRKLVPGDRWQVFEQHTFRGRAKRAARAARMRRGRRDRRQKERPHRPCPRPHSGLSAGMKWCARRELNPQPSAPEADALSS